MTKNILYSVLPLLISLILFIFVGRYGVGRVIDLRGEISQANVDKNTLSAKLSALRSLSATVSSNSLSSSIALPEKNSAIAVLGQLKNLAAQNVISLSNIKSGVSASSASVSSVSITFDLAGPRDGIFSFLQGVRKFAPITLVDKVRLNQSGDAAQATVSVTTFWASFPKSIPAVTQPVNTLTSDELNILTSIGSLTQPQFSDVPPAQGGKADPFAK